MIPSCKNCRYCDIRHKGKYISPNGRVTYGYRLKTYVCGRDMLFKNPDTLCSNWEHKNRVIRRLWRFFND